MLEPRGILEIILINFFFYSKEMALHFPLFIADHSFLGFEWQKRWCALSKTVFYYYGSDKGNVGVQLYQLLLHKNFLAIPSPSFGYRVN